MTIRGLAHEVALVLEDPPDCLTDVQIVVNDQDLRRHAVPGSQASPGAGATDGVRGSDNASFCGGGPSSVEGPGSVPSGSLTVKVLPWPSSLSTSMRPACCSTTRRAVASPIPVPAMRPLTFVAR